MNADVKEQKKYWEDFYRKNFSIEKNFSELRIASFDSQKYDLVIIAAGLFFDEILEKAEKVMGVKIKNELSFGGQIVSIREAETDYFVLVSKNLTKISFLGSDQRATIRAKDQVTLNEGFLFLMAAFEKRPKDFFSLVLSVFACGASRLEGKRNILLPGLVYEKNSKTLHIVWYDGFYAEANLDKLQVAFI